MRMRHKPNLEPRLERVSHLFAHEPEALRGIWKTAFGDFRGLFLELGCGKGKFTAETAAQSKDALVVGVERSRDAIVVAVERAQDAGVSNARFVAGDANSLATMFAPGEVNVIFINFCDPWRKARHAKRRLTSPGFLKIYAEILAPGGEIRFKTDDVPLFDYSMEAFADCGFVVTTATYDLHKDSAAGVLTDYEMKFVASGKKICAATAAAAW